MGGENSSNLVNSSNFNDGGTCKWVSHILFRYSSNAGFYFKTFDSTPKSENRWLLYNNANNDRGWVGGIGGVIGLSSTASASDRVAIEGYLAHK